MAGQSPAIFFCISLFNYKQLQTTQRASSFPLSGDEKV